MNAHPSARIGKQTVIGWDVGGAHLKAARIEMDGGISAVWLEACPLWRGLDYLHAAIDRIMASISVIEPRSLLHAITMTGELTDLFETRQAGVRALATIMSRRLGSNQVGFYAGRHGWLDARLALQHTEQVASANWHATAQLLSTCVDEAILVDIGSTTTDIIPVKNGNVATTSNSDGDRLASGELVYTGVVRTPAMAMADEAPVLGRFTPLMAEYFATSSDIYRVLGLLPENADLHDSADGGSKTPEASRIRLARMVGRDAAELTDKAWIELASWFADAQSAQICRALRQVLSRETLSLTAPLVITGAGKFLGPRLAARMERPVIGFSRVVHGNDEDMVDWCAPSVAVAMLLALRDRHPPTDVREGKPCS